MSVDVHLYLKRKPGLQLDVDQAEVAVHEVVIKKQALAACGSHERLALLRAEGKRAAGLQNGEDTDQPVFDVITLGDLPRQFLFPHLLLEILKRPAFFLGQIQAMLLHAGRVLQKKRFQFPVADIGVVEELRHLPAAHDRQIAAEQHPVEAGQHAVNPIRVFRNEFPHGSILHLQRP